MNRFACPTCHRKLKSPPGFAGCKTTCPKCGQRLMVPSREPRPTSRVPVPSPRVLFGERLPEPLPLADRLRGWLRQAWREVREYC